MVTGSCSSICCLCSKSTHILPLASSITAWLELLSSLSQRLENPNWSHCPSFLHFSLPFPSNYIYFQIKLLAPFKSSPLSSQTRILGLCLPLQLPPSVVTLFISHSITGPPFYTPRHYEYHCFCCFLCATVSSSVLPHSPFSPHSNL
jgi:hypothetical protein